MFVGQNRPLKQKCRELLAKTNRKFDNYLTLGGANLLDVETLLNKGVINRQTNVESWEIDNANRYFDNAEGGVDISSIYRVACRTANNLGLVNAKIKSGDIISLKWTDDILPYERSGSIGQYNYGGPRFDLVFLDFCGTLKYDRITWVEHLLRYGISSTARFAATFLCVPRGRKDIDNPNHPLIERYLNNPGKYASIINSLPYIDSTENVRQLRNAQVCAVLHLADKAGLQYRKVTVRTYHDHTPGTQGSVWMMFILIQFVGRIFLDNTRAMTYNKSVRDNVSLNVQKAIREVKVMCKNGKTRGLKAGTVTAKLAGLLASYARSHSNGNKVAKQNARDGIAKLVGLK